MLSLVYMFCKLIILLDPFWEKTMHIHAWNWIQRNELIIWGNGL